MSKESQGRNFLNTALFRHAGLHEHQMAKFCLHVVFKGTGQMFIDLGLPLFGLAWDL